MCSREDATEDSGFKVECKLLNPEVDERTDATLNHPILYRNASKTDLFVLSFRANLARSAYTVIIPTDSRTGSF